MPLWRIFSHPSTFSPVQRQDLAKAVTALYVSRGLPAFYVNVIFVDLPDADGANPSCFVGGEPRPNFVRVVVEQIARTMAASDTDQGKERRRKWMDLINETLKPSIIDRPEIDWELHIYETPRDLWRIQGLDPPPAFSDAEKVWVEKNKPIPYEKL
ncbi:hypothetical protein G647_02216 [Cladophialophora carrionii CBS 160.54]|uniref:Tautomerase cis-CaaD-like domain-containing protein n=1 Tax=Cladophialophora carrionii CBS 160.54 TaxID=1279043 RepID=V9DGK3_9EURO|nr:uncharacterized protein G647_02216 [Cladophialophora carrionii CBS 160.54]ETI25443.1 hypothetical protein G647_02216 [Cladophialophora carrionii CBS 160.54]